MTKFKNKSGTLTAYAFACGYIEVAKNGTKLFMEHNHYHVRKDHKHWYTFDSDRLTKARACFRALSEDNFEKAEQIWNEQ